ncbi:MAG: Tol-Pal system subunit TolQ, partial [Desulfuromusa sp.]|nr:Tol-Pal system subunit TolQ [Desulfuromusa sp.]
MLELVLNAGPVVKLVLLILVYFSLVSWAIIFYKVSVIQRAIKESDRFLDFFWQKKRFDLVGQGIKEFSHSPIATLFREGYHEMLQLKKKSADPD